MKWLLNLLASVPARLGYALSKLAFVLVFYVFRYRRDTVRENLAYAFPAMQPQDRAALEKNFYRHFCDLFIEILRTTRMPAEELTERVSFANEAVLREATRNYTQQAIILCVHQGNWEWMLHSAKLALPVAIAPVYKTLHSPFWDDFMLKARSRFGARPMNMENVAREVIRGRRERRLIVVVADQSGPKFGGYWTDFLNRPASFYRGAAKLAKTLKLPVIFAQCLRQSQGRYEIRFHPVSLPPHSSDSEAILESYVRIAEAVITEQPETYLWTNRRWKKTPPTNIADAPRDEDRTQHP
ncbi:MAG: lysophospholipid acyltransferase family protein [Congregibacter sp.]